MCNIAGYIGTERAAPVLISMMAAQEGFAGGYYSGIATVADGRMHVRKTVGDLAALLRDTDAEALPGTVGIIHSRSKSGGDAEWAHPFVSCDEQLAYIANGADGIFASRRDQDAVTATLATAGHILRSATAGRIGKYPVLPDGRGVHTSEVMCHLIESLVRAGSDPARAMQEAYVSFPAEIVGLLLAASDGDRIVAARINQPLMLGRGRAAATAETGTPQNRRRPAEVGVQEPQLPRQRRLCAG